jgi:hypothetical protein
MRSEDVKNGRLSFAREHIFMLHCDRAGLAGPVTENPALVRRTLADIWGLIFGLEE